MSREPACRRRPDQKRGVRKQLAGKLLHTHLLTLVQDHHQQERQSGTFILPLSGLHITGVGM